MGRRIIVTKPTAEKTEVKVRGITLDCTARQKVNFHVICALVFLRGECGVTGQVSVNIPFRITRNTQTKEIQTKRKKKDYRIVYNIILFCLLDSGWLRTVPINP